jgi:hypothetical protein
MVSKDNHEPTTRAGPRGFVRRKPECKRCEAESGRNQSDGLFMPGEVAGQWPGAACKVSCAACGALCREQDPDGCAGIPTTRRRGELPAPSEEIGSDSRCGAQRARRQRRA